MMEALVRILLAIDDSKFSEAATETLIAQARPQETEVLILHVIELYTLFPAGGLTGAALPHSAACFHVVRCVFGLALRLSSVRSARSRRLLRKI